MILFLNYLPWMLGLIALLLIWRACKKHYGKDSEKLTHRILEILLLLVLLELALVAIGNTYVPRGTVEPLQNPAFDESSQDMTDKLRKPQRTTEQSDEHLKEISDWRKHKKEREQENQQ